MMNAKKWTAIVSTAAIIGGCAAIPAFAATQTDSNQTASSQTDSTHAKKQAAHHNQFDQVKKELVSVLGVDAKTLKKDLESGQSIADIAKSKGIPESTLVADLQNKLKDRLDKAVSDGKLTADKENQIFTNAQTRFTKLVENKHLLQHKKENVVSEITSILGIDAKTLTADLKSGQSIADVAASKGVPEQKLVDGLTSQLKTKLDQAVQNGKLSSDKENQILTNATKRFTKLIEHKGLQQLRQFQHHKEKTNSQASQQNQNQNV